MIYVNNAEKSSSNWSTPDFMPLKASGVPGCVHGRWCWGPTGDPLSPGVGSVQVTIVELADTGSHGHATCHLQQVSLPGVSINHNAPGCHVLFSEVEGLCVGRDHT